MATIDMTHRKLNFPPRFLPYLEKHRIFELLHECVELLVQVQPQDHIKFLKNVLPCAAMKKDKQRIVFLSPDSFDRETFCELLADCLGIQVVNLYLLDLLTRARREEGKVPEPVPESAEEESCICPGEGQRLEIPGELYYAQEAGPYVFDFAESEKVEEEEPCICVCPCVRKEQEKKGDGDDEEEGEYPCEPSERKHKKRKKKCDRPEKEFQRESQLASMTTSKTDMGLGTGLEGIDFGILAECEQGAKGWILEDFPMTVEEAEKLSSLGVIPTHAIRIIIDEEEEERDRDYKAFAKGWTKVYKYVPVVEIRVNARNMSELVKDMCSLLSLMPHRHAPMLPRVVLIGSRGSGVTTQGEKLARKYGMVHVEFELVISRALQQDDELSKMYKLQLATRPDPELEAFFLERALLTRQCRNRGWVLTGYPKNIDQMRMLDIIATPPNRVIFIEVPARECFVRLFYRKIDPCLGDEYKIPEIQPSGVDSFEAPDLEPEIANRLLSHPKNNKKQIIHDIEQHFMNKTDMMSYCGKTASYVDGNQEVDRVFEQIEQILINPAPPQPPRDPLAINFGIDEAYQRLKKYRLASGMYFNNLLLNPPK